jgi:mannose-1-phosphate guanylyltransferase
MLAFHRERGASATIALHHVADARAFGLVETEPDGRVLEFREKPEDAVPGEINAGTYLLDPAALAPWEPGAAISVEREVFPAVIASGRPVYGFESDAYWLDLGTPEKYLEAHFAMLEGKVHGVSYPAPWVAEGADIDLRAHLGRWVAVGAGAHVGPEAQIDDSVLHENATVEGGARVVRSILGRGARVGAGATVEDSVLGQDASVPDAVVAHGIRVPAGAALLPE